MPWHIGRSAKCPAGKPYAVIKDADGTVEGCHPSRAAAKKQMAALYANEPATSRFEAELDEVRGLAAADELRRFFVKTEAGIPAAKAKPATFGPAAAAQLLARKQDPWG